MGPVWRNSIYRTVRTAHLSVLMTVHRFSTQYNTEQFWKSPLLPPHKHHSSHVVYWRRFTSSCTRMNITKRDKTKTIQTRDFSLKYLWQPLFWRPCSVLAMLYASLQTHNCSTCSLHFYALQHNMTPLQWCNKAKLDKMNPDDKKVLHTQLVYQESRQQLPAVRVEIMVHDWQTDFTKALLTALTQAWDSVHNVFHTVSAMACGSYRCERTTCKPNTLWGNARVLEETPGPCSNWLQNTTDYPTSFDIGLHKARKELQLRELIFLLALHSTMHW